MSQRGPFARLLLCGALLGAGALAVIGGLALRGPGLVVVGVSGVLAACAAAGIARESPRREASPIDSAVLAAAWTFGVLLVLAGLAALAGGVVAVLAVGLAAAALAVVRVGSGQGARTAAGIPSERLPDPLAQPPVDLEVLLLPVPPPVSAMTTQALGREWLRTTAALDGPLRPAVREAVVQRRQQALDELERRDPAGFSRWLTSGAGGRDPADYVRGRALPEGPAADTDAA